MSPVGKPAVKPKLRFPEFRDAEGWEERELDELISTITPPKRLPTSEYLTEGLFPIVDQSQRHICGWTNDDDAVIKDELPLLVFGDHTCVLKFVNRPFAQGADGIKIIKSGADTTIEYLYQFLQFRPLVTEDYKRHFSALKERRVFHPQIKSGEQQKIADCLSSVDELIAAEARKLDALKTNKNGLMQQLFPREGETQPRLRFPEFRDAGEWEEDALANLCIAKISYGIVQAGPHVPNGMPYVKSTDLNSELCIDRLDRTSDVIAKKYQRSEVVPGDLVFSLRGNIGVAQIVPQAIQVANLTQGTARIRTKGPSRFYLQALKSQAIHSRIMAVSKGSTFQEISLEDLRKIRLFHPEGAEQQRIADCLTSLDELIAAQTKKFDALKTHKKGLMQQLFPSPGEVEA